MPNLLVIGCGSIGRRHLRNLRTLGVERLVACDANLDRLAQVAQELSISSAFTDYRDALDGIDAVVVCTPTSLHLPVALEAARRGVNIFMEKPLSHNMESVDELLSLVKERGLIMMMGMCYRFHPGLAKVKELIDNDAIGRVLTALIWGGYYLPSWHPGADYRTEYSAQRRLGGGVVMDSIHSLDSLRWLFGEPVDLTCMYDRVSDLEIDTEDTASMLIKIESGAVVEVHVDYLNRVDTRLFQIVGEKGTIEWDYAGNRVRLFSAKEGTWQVHGYSFEANDMYLVEMEHFLACVNDGTRPLIDGADGVKTLELALAAKKSSEERRFVRMKEGCWE